MTVQTTSALRPVVRHWPILAGLAFAAVVAFGVVLGADLAKVLAASAVVYVGAAAVEKPVAAWPMFLVTVVVITVVEVADVGFDATWAVLAVGVLLAAYGVVRGVRRPMSGLPLQAVALLGFGATAAVALLVAPVVGGYLVALGLLGHAGWDLYHYRARKVVAPSLAEFCIALDTVLAVVIIVVTAS